MRKLILEKTGKERNPELELLIDEVVNELSQRFNTKLEIRNIEVVITMTFMVIFENSNEFNYRNASALILKLTYSHQIIDNIENSAVRAFWKEEYPLAAHDFLRDVALYVTGILSVYTIEPLRANDLDGIETLREILNELARNGDLHMWIELMNGKITEEISELAKEYLLLDVMNMQ